MTVGTATSGRSRLKTAPVAEPNTKNAHVRKGHRENPEVVAADAERLLNDPAFIRGFEAVREGVIREIENIKHDGQEETENYELELCRTLRNLQAVKRAIGSTVQGQKLRLADFRPREDD